MVYKNLNLPATLVHEVNGKKYTLNGKLLGINESTKTATMRFGDKESQNIPLNEVYLNESALSDLIKKAGKKVKSKIKEIWNKLVGIAKTVGGFLVPVDENGNSLFQYINNPLNLAVMPLPDSVKFAPSDSTLEICEENGADVVNDGDIDEAFEALLANEREEIETYWSRVMKEYTQNESMNLKDTIKMVNEKYYTRFEDKIKPLNETVLSLNSGDSDLYGEAYNTQELIGLLEQNIISQITKNIHGKQEAKPVLVWGAPGIGKTAIIKQVTKILKNEYDLNFDMTTVACSGIQIDDFELPDVVENEAGQKIAVSTTRTWLPVFDDTGLSQEQLEYLDNFYNTGKYRIRKRMKDSLKDRKAFDEDGNLKGDVVEFDELVKGSTFDGGIIFFDELGRLNNPNTLNTMMDIADRHYKGLRLASKWCTLFASNRLSDDNKSELDDEFHQMWGQATKNRFTHVTYVPTKAEWLAWAREISDKTPGASGYQNVDELICKFIEKMPDGVWYDSLDFDSRTIEGKQGDAQYKAVVDAIEKFKSGTPLTMADYKAIGSYTSSAGRAKHNLSMLTWNGRTWDQKIYQPFMDILKNHLFLGHPEKFEACFSETDRVREIDGGYSSVQYKAKNLDLAKLAEQLNSIPDNRWSNWCSKQKHDIDPNGELRETNRVGFVLAVLGSIIRRETGETSLPYTSWDRYQKIDSLIDKSDIKSIYDKGQMKKPAMRKDDNILVDPRAKYQYIQNVKWKSDMANVDEVVSQVLDAFDNYIRIEDIVADMNNIKKNLGRYNVTKQEIDRYKDDYTLHLTDEKGKEIKTILTIFDPRFEYEEGVSEEKMCNILKNSEVAKKLANIAMWLSKIAIQVSQNTPIDFALGMNGTTLATGTIQDRLRKIIAKSPEAMAFLQGNDFENYALEAPALCILQQMRQYVI